MHGNVFCQKEDMHKLMKIAWVTWVVAGKRLDDITLSRGDFTLLLMAVHSVNSFLSLNGSPSLEGIKFA